MSRNIIAYNKQTIGSPAMNAIATLYFIVAIRFYWIVFYSAVSAMLTVYAKVGIIQFIIDTLLHRSYHTISTPARSLFQPVLHLLF